MIEYSKMIEYSSEVKGENAANDITEREERIKESTSSMWIEHHTVFVCLLYKSIRDI